MRAVGVLLVAAVLAAVPGTAGQAAGPAVPGAALGWGRLPAGGGLRPGAGPPPAVCAPVGAAGLSSPARAHHHRRGLPDRDRRAGTAPGRAVVQPRRPGATQAAVQATYDALGARFDSDAQARERAQRAAAEYAAVITSVGIDTNEAIRIIRAALTNTIAPSPSQSPSPSP